MKYFNCKSVPEFIDMILLTLDYLEKKDGSYLGDLFTAEGKSKNAGLNNYTISAKEYHEILGMGNYQAQPWCNVQTSIWFAMGFGLELGKKLARGWESYVESDYQRFKKAGKTGRTPKLGAKVFFWSSSLGRHGHTAICVGVDSNGKGFTTVEGNTGSGNNIVIRNGGAITRKHYDSLSANSYFGYIDYEENGISLTREEKPIYESHSIGTGAKRLIATAPIPLFDDKGNSTGTINPGEVFWPDTKRYVDGVTQFYVYTSVGQGWAVPLHCYGWIYEHETGKWWYINSDDKYKWLASTIAEIDGKYYYFDDTGYCMMDGSITFETDENGALHITNIVED